MNRSFKDYAVPGAASRSLLHSSVSHHRRGHSLSTIPRDSHDNLDLFCTDRRSVSLASSDDPSGIDRTVSLQLGKISVGSAKSAKSGLDDLLTSTDGGKHDYDWLLTPPETPLFPSAERNEFQQSFTAPRISSATKSASTKSSRPSTTHVESNVSSKPARSSSVTRSSISYSQSSGYSSIRSSSILNTSCASVSSHIRPSSPITRSSSTARSSTPSARSTPSRSSTPSKARSAPILPSIDKPRPSLGSRPSTPSSRSQIAANLSSPATPLSSRPSTPTRGSTISSSSSSPGPSTVRALSNGRSQTSASRPSSPSLRNRPQQPVIPPDFLLDTPPNLRTTLPDRPISAGRSRPVPAGTAKANTGTQGHGNFPRRASAPIVTRGRSVEAKGRSHVHSNGHTSEVQEPRRSLYVPESPSRRTLRASTTTDSAGFGRTISKKSLDMAIKHMDIRNGSGSMRSLAGTVLYPQSIRSATSKSQATHTSNKLPAGEVNGRLSVSDDGFISENGKYATGALQNGKKEENGRLFGRVSEVDMFESSRYDAILLKEDAKNTNWLLSGDGKSDQGLMFDHGFEPLPEPYGIS